MGPKADTFQWLLTAGIVSFPVSLASTGVAGAIGYRGIALNRLHGGEYQPGKRGIHSRSLDVLQDAEYGTDSGDDFRFMPALW